MPSKIKNRLLFVVNEPSFFISHRLPIALAARTAGYDVQIATIDGAGIELLRKHKFLIHIIPLTRSGRNPLKELKSLWGLFRLFTKVKPDIVHLVAIKSVLYGGIAARFAKINATVAAVSGLGTVFIARNYRARLLRWFVCILYRVALGHKNSKVIFQNPDDSKLFLELNLVVPKQVVMISGSGVVIEDYPFMAEPNGLPVVVLASRMLKDKGIIEFIEAAKYIKLQGIKAKFCLAGDIDKGNPTTISQEQLEYWHHEGVVEYLGYKSDIPQLFAQSNIVVLPSYREGLPKVLIEAASCGRAVVTTNVPGCRHAIIPNLTGILVPAKDYLALAKAIDRLLKDKNLRTNMGAAARKHAECEFRIEKVINTHMNLYFELTEQ